MGCGGADGIGSDMVAFVWYGVEGEEGEKEVEGRAEGGDKECRDSVPGERRTRTGERTREE